MKINPKNMTADQLVNHYASEYAQKTTARSEWVNNTIKNHEGTRNKILGVGAASGVGALAAFVGAASAPILLPAVAVPLIAVGVASLAAMGMNALKTKIAETMKPSAEARLADLKGSGRIFQTEVESKVQAQIPGLGINLDRIKQMVQRPAMKM